MRHYVCACGVFYCRPNCLSAEQMECAPAPLGQLASWLMATAVSLPLASHQYAKVNPSPQMVASLDLSRADDFFVCLSFFFFFSPSYLSINPRVSVSSVSRSSHGNNPSSRPRCPCSGDCRPGVFALPPAGLGVLRLPQSQVSGGRRRRGPPPPPPSGAQ